jgi:hypothetical protein
MNRKQRRALRHRGTQPPLGSITNTASTKTLASRAEMHSMVGAALMAQNKASEAIPHYSRH